MRKRERVPECATSDGEAGGELCEGDRYDQRL